MLFAIWTTGDKTHRHKRFPEVAGTLQNSAESGTEAPTGIPQRGLGWSCNGSGWNGMGVEQHHMGARGKQVPGFKFA